MQAMDLLAIAKAERARLDKVIALLEAGAPTTTPSTPKAKGKTKANATRRGYWTPARRKAMSVKIKALQAKKKKPEAHGKGQAAKKA